MPQAVIAKSYTVAGQVVAEAYTSLAAVVPWLRLTERVKLAELARTELVQTELVRTELVRTELARAELAWAELVRAELVWTEQL